MISFMCQAPGQRVKNIALPLKELVVTGDGAFQGVGSVHWLVSGPLVLRGDWGRSAQKSSFGLHHSDGVSHQGLTIKQGNDSQDHIRSTNPATVHSGLGDRTQPSEPDSAPH